MNQNSGNVEIVLSYFNLINDFSGIFVRLFLNISSRKKIGSLELDDRNPKLGLAFAITWCPSYNMYCDHKVQEIQKMK
jgi:hypothetical protein